MNNNKIKGVIVLLDKLSLKRVIGWVTLTCFWLTLLWSSGIRADTIDDLIKKKNESKKLATVTTPTNFSVMAQMTGANYTTVKDEMGNLYLVSNNNKGQVAASMENVSNDVVKVTVFDNSKTEKKVSYSTLIKKDFLSNVEGGSLLRFLIKTQNRYKTEGIEYNKDIQKEAILIIKWKADFDASSEKIKQQMASEIGATKEEVENFSQETQQKIRRYLQHSKKSLSGPIVSMFLSNIINWFKRSFSSEVSVFEIQQTAAKKDVKLIATKIDEENLKIVTKDSPVIVILKDDNNKYCFEIVSKVDDNNVYLLTKGGKNIVSMSIEEFRSKWDGNTLVAKTLADKVELKVLNDKTIGEILGNFKEKNLISRIWGINSSINVGLKLDVVFGPNTPNETLQGLANDKNKFVSESAKIVLTLREAGLDSAISSKIAKLILISRYSGDIRNKILAETQVKEFCRNLIAEGKEKVARQVEGILTQIQSSPNQSGNMIGSVSTVIGRVLESIGVGSVRVVSKDTTTEKVEKGSFDESKQVETEGYLIEKKEESLSTEEKTDSEKALETVEQLLLEYVEADPAKKAEIAAQLGIPVDQLVDISIEQAQQIIAYLKENGKEIINCAGKALGNVLLENGIETNLAEISARLVLVDILTGNLQTTSKSDYDASQIQISMYALQKVAATYGVKLTGYKTDIEEIEQATSQGPVIVHVDLGDGMGHYITVNEVKNGFVTYKDVDGKEYTVSVSEFNGRFRDGINILAQNENLEGVKLSEAELKYHKGAFFDEIFKAVGDAIGGAVKAVGDAIGGAVKAVGDAIGGGIQAIGNFLGTVGNILANVGNTLWNGTKMVFEGAWKVTLGVLQIGAAVVTTIVGGIAYVFSGFNQEVWNNYWSHASKLGNDGWSNITSGVGQV